MIVHDKFIIASSTKSGTHSCMSLARATEGMEYIRTNHMMVVPAEHAEKDRLFLVRHPHDRLLSIYHHIYRKYTEWGHRYIKNMEFDEFCNWFLDQRAEKLESSDSYGAPGVWIRTAKDNWDELTSDDHLPKAFGVPCYWFRIEEFAVDFFPWLVDRYELSTKRDSMPRSNTADRFLEREARTRQIKVGLGLEKRIWNEWSAADIQFFGYGTTWDWGCM